MKAVQYIYTEKNPKDFKMHNINQKRPQAKPRQENNLSRNQRPES